MAFWPLHLPLLRPSGFFSLVVSPCPEVRWCPVSVSVFVRPRCAPLRTAWGPGSSPLSLRHMLPQLLRGLLPLSLLLLVPHSLLRPRSIVVLRMRGGFFFISAYSTALLAAASAATCSFRCSFCAFFSNCACSSCSVAGSRRCLARCSVSILACFPLSGSMQFSRCRMSGVRGIGSLSLPPRDPDPTLAPDTELKLSLSLSLSSVPLPSGAN